MKFGKGRYTVLKRQNGQASMRAEIRAHLREIERKEQVEAELDMGMKNVAEEGSDVV